MKYLFHIIIITILLLSFSACQRHSDAWAQLNHADSIMASAPDSALILLNNINPSQLSGNEEKARYALLHSIAFDKNYIDTTSFDVLQPAIDYYLKHGTPNEKIRTLYYQGRIYQNQHNDDMAMQSFLNAIQESHIASDSLLIAHLLVAQGTLYFKLYQTDNFISNNLKAANIYKQQNKLRFAIKSYSNALDGANINNNKLLGDSIISICNQILEEYPSGISYLYPPLLIHSIKYGNNSDILNIIKISDNINISDQSKLNIALGYTKTGNSKLALDILENTNLSTNLLDSLKYALIKSDAFDSIGDYKNALECYQDYIYFLEKYQENIFSTKLLFSEDKHKIELENSLKIHNRDTIILISSLGVIFLLLACMLIYYKYRLTQSKRLITDHENNRLRLEHDILIKQQSTLKLEQEKSELEAENLRLEIYQLQQEQAQLNELLNNQQKLTNHVKDIINHRLELLNGLLAAEISENETYAIPFHNWVRSILKDRTKFIDDNRIAISVSHPSFIDFLNSHGLTTNEINYVCLYAIGLRGKEVGEYIQLKRHYNISSEIRKKLGIDGRVQNIGPYIRTLIENM